MSTLSNEVKARIQGVYMTNFGPLNNIQKTAQLAANEVASNIEGLLCKYTDPQGNLRLSISSDREVVVTLRDLKTLNKPRNIYTHSNLSANSLSKIDDSNLFGDKSITDTMNEVGANNEIISAGTSTIADLVANSGVCGAVVGAGIEAVSQFNVYKKGRLSAKQYAVEIAKTGGQFGLKGSAISAVMLQVSTIASIGSYSSPITVPVVIVLNYTLDQVLAPMFSKGEYKEIHTTMTYYADTGDVYEEFMSSVLRSKSEFSHFLSKLNRQETSYLMIKEKEKLLNSSLNEALGRLHK